MSGDPMIGPGGAPTRATTIPEGSEARKRTPIASGVLDYFPDAIVAVAEVSFKGNEKHNPGQPLNWNRAKSGDEADAIARHLLQRGLIDPDDGLRHSAHLAWRALALLQKEIEAGQAEAEQSPQTIDEALRERAVKVGEAAAFTSDGRKWGTVRQS